MRVYIAGPYTKGDVSVNVRNAIVAADAVLESGHVPFIPHLTHFWHLVCPHEYEVWLSVDLVWLGQCDCVLRLPGESGGADREVTAARRLGMPIFCSVEEVKKYAGV